MPRAHWLRGDGAVIALGTVIAQEPFDARRVLSNLMTGEEIVGEGDVVPRTPAPIDFFQGPFGFNSNGRLLGFKVIQEVDGRRALVVEGEVLEVLPGSLVLEGELVPADPNGGISAQRWSNDLRLHISDRHSLPVG